VKEYLDIDQEAAAVTEVSHPPSDWPSHGEVNFVGYSTRYRPDLEPVLHHIDLEINPGQKVGIVGRTGAGKSSLALALFRGLEAETGRILVDGVDVGTIALRDLRRGITIVPQDPTLFEGTVRNNLDPFDSFRDETIYDALRSVGLLDAIEEGSVNRNPFTSLSAPIAAGGANVSQGQRQLLCLARALLQKPKIIILDEATASIDYNTDRKIQHTLRGLEATTITIAHRLETVVSLDKVVVMQEGRVVEEGAPAELLRSNSGVFVGMCRAAGEEGFVKLREVAEKEGRQR
jgi:ABC-type multidrug transport system fused ATPase/permease subunit